MLNFHSLKSIFAIILSFSFFFSTIIMPYGNFDDTDSIQSSYKESQQEDTDIDISEFVFNRLLTIGGFFDDDDDASNIPQNHQPVPMQVQSLQSGSLFCSKLVISEQDKKPIPAKPMCMFRENKFPFDFHASIFHPPANIS